MEWLVVFNLAGYGIIPVSPLWLTIVDLGGQLPESGNLCILSFILRLKKGLLQSLNCFILVMVLSYAIG